MDASNVPSYEHALSVTFKFKYSKKKALNKSNLFTFDDLKKFSLAVRIDCQNSCQFNVKFSMDFCEYYSFDENKSFELIAYFDESMHGHVFTLHKFDDKHYESHCICIYESSIDKKTEFDIAVKISFSNNNYNFLLKNMQYLLRQKSYTDLKLIVQDKVYDVHKNILLSRSEVLAKMIESNMLEKKTDTISFSKWDPLVVEEFLNFIYTGICDVTKCPHELFKFSHFLQIKELQQLCKDYLKSNISMVNLIDILELTKVNQYDLKDLEKLAMAFIKKHEFVLSKRLDFIEYLHNSITVDNITFVLKFSNRYNKEHLLSTAMKYVCSNHKEVLNNKICKDFLFLNPPLMYKVLKYSLDEHNTSET